MVGQAAIAQAAPRKSHVARGIAFAALGGICWGFSGTCAQLMTSELGVPVAWITCVRLLLGALIFLVACLFKNWRSLRAVLRDKRSLLRIAAFSMFGVLLTQMSYLSAISYTNAGTGTVLERLGLVVIMFIVCVRVRRWPKPRELFGLVFALGGTFLIATKGNIGALAIPAEGLMWGVVSAFALAAYTLLPGKVLAKWGSFIVTGLAMLLGGTVATVFVQPWSIPVDITPELVGVMGAMVIIGTFAAYLFYLQGITDAGPVRAGLVGCVEPVSATVISAVWLGTPVTPVDVAGIAMIVVMVLLVTQREEAPAKGEGGLDGSPDDLPPFEGRASLLGYYRSRPATHDDFVRFQEVLEDGHEALAALGIEEKGSKKYPSERRVMRHRLGHRPCGHGARAHRRRGGRRRAHHRRVCRRPARRRGLWPFLGRGLAHRVCRASCRGGPVCGPALGVRGIGGAPPRRGHVHPGRGRAPREGCRQAQPSLRCVRGQRAHARAAHGVRLLVLRHRCPARPPGPRETPRRVRAPVVKAGGPAGRAIL